jgi:fructose-bisphosphate aldolase class II
MSLVSFQEMLADATRRHYAVPMFDVSNATMMRAAVETAEEAGSPVILASIPFDIVDDTTLGYWHNSALYAAQQVKVPVCLHLDHAVDVETCRKCIDLDYQSVMIDASAKDFAENVRLSAEVVRLAHAKGIAVEAELGHVASGITGAADGGSENGIRKDCNTTFTDPDSLVQFLDQTGVDALAVSIGTTHGVYISAPRLDIPLLQTLKAAAGDIPLVLHGGSGTPEDQLSQAIEHGIAKVNIYSELTAAWNTAMRDFLNRREQMTCWFVVACKEPDAAMRKVMREKMRICKSAGRY